MELVVARVLDPSGFVCFFRGRGKVFDELDEFCDVYRVDAVRFEVQPWDVTPVDRVVLAASTDGEVSVVERDLVQAVSAN
jgi:hypothetical protein